MQAFTVAFGTGQLKILLDECTPRIVKKRLPYWNIKTVQEMGWAGVKNGRLLKLVEDRFEILISTDKNLPYQQNLSNRRLAVIILPSNKVTVVSLLIPAIDQALKTVRPGAFLEISLPKGT